jgi:hypothetical protein
MNDSAIYDFSNLTKDGQKWSLIEVVYTMGTFCNKVMPITDELVKTLKSTNDYKKLLLDEKFIKNIDLLFLEIQHIKIVEKDLNDFLNIYVKQD